ncbi:MAG TPA: hypothetical protein QGF27_08310 [Arenicellales bacterium]|nr:hypothetical protein [Arenicellales bacterium]
MKRFHSILTSLCTAVLVLFMGFATPAQAIAPAGAKLGITVTVSHDKDDGEPEETEAAGVTIGLSPAAPTLSMPPDQTVLPGQSISYSYTITTNANGSETYDLNAVVTMVDNIDGSPAVSFEQDGGPITSVILGATAVMTAQSAGNDFIYVPSDGNFNNNVNSIDTGDTVVIGGSVYEVGGVIYETLYDNKMISLTENLVADVAVGDSISERQGFEMIISGVGVADPDSVPGSIFVTATAASASDDTLSTPDESITSVLVPVGPSLETYVRNETDPTTGSDPAYVDSLGQGFFDPNVVAAKGGDTLQYLIIQKAGNTESLTGVKMQVAMPLFTSYVAGSTAMNDAPVADVGDPPQSPLIDGLEVHSTAATPVVEAGTISVNSLVTVTFKVKVKMDEPTGGETEGGNGALSNASIQWETDPDRVTFTWAVTGLSSEYEYWVYPHVGFTENGGPFGSTPEDEANNLKGMYSMATPNYRSAGDGAGSWNWYGGKPTNPSGRLALLAYDASSGNAWVVDISEEINIDAW